MPRRVPLVALVAMVMTVCMCDECIPGPCSVTGRTLENINVGRFTGVWYLKSAYKALGRYHEVTGYKFEVAIMNFNQRDTMLLITRTWSPYGSNTCITRDFSCILKGNTCTQVSFPHAFTIVTIDYDTVFGHWSELWHGNMCDEIFSLYVRDPRAPTDLSDIQSDLQQYCGADATNSSSSFYELQLSYDNVPSCIF